jgi:hypothetical protein
VEEQEDKLKEEARRKEEEEYRIVFGHAGLPIPEFEDSEEEGLSQSLELSSDSEAVSSSSSTDTGLPIAPPHEDSPAPAPFPPVVPKGTCPYCNMPVTSLHIPRHAIKRSGVMTYWHDGCFQQDPSCTTAKLISRPQ